MTKNKYLAELLLTREELLEDLQDTVESFGKIQPVKRRADPNNMFLKKAGISGGEIFIKLPEKFLNHFSLPKDCQLLASLHVAWSLRYLMSKGGFFSKIFTFFTKEKEDIKELRPLHAMYLQKALELGWDPLSYLSEENISFIEAWKQKLNKYANNKKTIKAIQDIVLFINLLQSSKRI